jgi:predicted phage baseplate assembly protein
VADPLYWIRARVVSGAYDMAPRLSSILSNTVRATQAQTVRDEIVGGSDARPGQTFTLANAPVVGPLQLELDEGFGFQAWQPVDDFYASGPDDPHYALDRASGRIVFGDGRRGRIPVANPANANSNIVARLYRWGGGAAGNAGANTIVGIQSYIGGVESVTNLAPASGGADVETVAQAKDRAPREIQAKGRAVTAGDFELLAMQTPGVLIRRAKAEPLMHPRFRGTPVPGAVSVVVVPQNDEPDPTPSSSTLQTVCAHLNLHRLLTSEVFVIPPVYRKIKVSADIAVRPEADLQQVQHAVEDGLTRFFHPLTGGQSGDGWPFGGEIFYSDVMQIVLQTAGVARVQNGNLTISLDGKAQPNCQDVAICQGELLSSDAHDIRVTYSVR